MKTPPLIAGISRKKTATGQLTGFRPKRNGRRRPDTCRRMRISTAGKMTEPHLSMPMQKPFPPAERSICGETSGNGHRLQSAVSVRSKAEHGTAAGLTAAPKPGAQEEIRTGDMKTSDSALSAKARKAGITGDQTVGNIRAAEPAGEIRNSDRILRRPDSSGRFWGRCRGFS